MTPGPAALIGLMQRYLGGLMDVSIFLLEIHKLMYLLQEAGEPLRLHLAKGPYGPYAQNPYYVLDTIEGHYTGGFGAGDDAPETQIELIGDAVRRSEAFLRDHPATQERFESVSKLIAGFETPFGMELLATVHWVAWHEEAATVGEAVEKTYAWGDRKQMFTAEQIRMAWQALAEHGWIEACGS